MQSKLGLQQCPLWISIDETTDVTGRAVANVFLGKLDNDHYHVPYLANCTYLE